MKTAAGRSHREYVNVSVSLQLHATIITWWNQTPTTTVKPRRLAMTKCTLHDPVVAIVLAFDTKYM